MTDPTIDSQIVQLRGSGADVFVDIATPKFAAQAIRKVYDSGWRPVHYLNSVANYVGSYVEPAGLDKSIGLISTLASKDPTDPTWNDDHGMLEWRAFMKKYYPDGDLTNNLNVGGFGAAYTLVHVLRQCGDNLTRENVMRQAASLKDFSTPTALPGILATTPSPTDFAPTKSMQPVRFERQRARFRRGPGLVRGR